MPLPTNLHELDVDTLRQLLVALDRELTWLQARVDQLPHELALHKRWRFGVKTERLPAGQAQLFEETIKPDLAAMSEVLANSPANRLRQSGQAQVKRCEPTKAGLEST